MTETRIVNSIRAHCLERARLGEPLKCVKLHGSQYQEAGTPDLHVTCHGRSLWLEVKTPTGRVSPLQAQRLAEWSAAGAVTAVVRSLDEVRSLLDRVALDAGVDRCHNSGVTGETPV